MSIEEFVIPVSVFPSGTIQTLPWTRSHSIDAAHGVAIDRWRDRVATPAPRVTVACRASLHRMRFSMARE
jgi:hypothetical protein